MNRVQKFQQQLLASSTNGSTGQFYTCDNFIGGKFTPPSSGKYMDIECPADGKVIGKVALSNAEDVDAAVKSSAKAFETWGQMSVKARAAILFKLHAALRDNTEMFADLIVLEHGKTKAEAVGEVNKGNETMEYATSMPQLLAGRNLEVSTGVECKDTRTPRGVVASIVPFNFPLMVPMWTLPIAIATGNCIVLKPSEKVPIGLTKLVELFQKTGLPDGVINIVHGAVDVVNGICDHPSIKAVTFVGSTKVAGIVHQRCAQTHKNVRAMGGAKNYLVAVPDCNLDMTANDVMKSFAGCAGQRCMAASVLLTVGQQPQLIAAVVAKAAALRPAGQGLPSMGPVIDQAAVDRITGYINQAERLGAKVLLDGRSWTQQQQRGYWVGPTVILHSNSDDVHLREEIFGPVVSIFQCKDKEHAIALENAVPYGNAACIYTSNGANAQWFTKRFSAGMIGVNIGVPVPREPFSFGGINASRYGDGDITGEGGIEFFTERRKITTKWTPPSKSADNWMS